MELFYRFHVCLDFLINFLLFDFLYSLRDFFVSAIGVPGELLFVLDEAHVVLQSLPLFDVCDSSLLLDFAVVLFFYLTGMSQNFQLTTAF
jgi:hypothetical protein